ncbi:MAG: putative toxin-antitoxin system toxin component, PIN family [Reyranella sp.]|uniref:putative toxin-antitoxin system toxin component, PIN family n=1 Tax=Reyranella sp. TaxID=1929291 RepID=UPI003D0AC7C1
MRVVLDTDVVVAGMRSPAGASAALLMAARSRRLVLLATVAMFIEYEAVCQRAEHREVAGLSRSEARQFLDALAQLVEAVEGHYLWRGRLRDPNDDMVLDAAINGQADAIVTFNRKDFGTVASEFDIEVLLPRDALRRITQ